MSYEYEFLDSLTKKNIHHAQCFNLTVRFIDDLLTVNNKYFRTYLPQIYPKELELKETTESNLKCSFLDLLLFSDDNQLKFKLYDKRDDFDFDIVNYPFIDSNIPTSPAYGVYVSRLVCFARICTEFGDFAIRHKLLADKLCKQGYEKKRLKQAFLMFCKGYSHLMSKYGVDLAEHINKILQ